MFSVRVIPCVFFDVFSACEPFSAGVVFTARETFSAFDVFSGCETISLCFVFRARDTFPPF